ncbi:low temperature requirement protein A [Actinomadura rubrisoli]|uniref:Low temperature requirement protein A n=1 Tax=Actinomadura rubrisoli TaxID=2530368 RepID=A0A4R5AM87_9ACTN|nr:low temperature requirement protein A [Actinomadura rubrisoli]TDD73743.1 low temperature requirement protein A [Actinomadura rubrisoli]
MTDSSAPPSAARPARAPALLRPRGEEGARVTFFELFFDLVFVFAITQLSHRLLEHLTPAGAAETLLLLLAVWWAWMYTCWTTNWFDPDHPAIRLMLVGVMIAGLFMAAMLPGAFGGKALWFAGAYTALQIGRTIFVVICTWRHELGRNFQRILFWQAVPACLWIGGALADGHDVRTALWLLAVALEYLAPWHGFATPLLGRSSTAQWTIDGGHMAERCQLFVIIALGESVLITGATLGGDTPSGPVAAGFVTSFVGTVALWWIYFDHTAEAAAEHIASSPDPGRLGRSAYTFIHIVMVAGIIVGGVADEMVMAHPGGHMSGGFAAVALGGPALFIAGHALFKRAVFGGFTRARLTALLVLAALAAIAPALTPLALHICAAAVVVVLALWDVRAYQLERRAFGQVPLSGPAPSRPGPPSGPSGGTFGGDGTTGR